MVCVGLKLTNHGQWKGLFNPDVIKTMQVLVSTYKSVQKKGKQGKKRSEKRQTELGILQLFENEGQKLINATKEKRERSAEEMENIAKVTAKLVMESNAPFSHTDPVKRPPPYEKDNTPRAIYPQLPVINQQGNYYIKDEDEQIIEMGKAETTIKTYPSWGRGLGLQWSRRVLSELALDLYF